MTAGSGPQNPALEVWVSIVPGERMPSRGLGRDRRNLLSRDQSSHDTGAFFEVIKSPP